MAKKKIRISSIVCVVLCLLVAFIALAPIVWMFFGSFKNKREILATPLRLLPTNWTGQNYDTVLGAEAAVYTRSILMTLAVSATAVVLSLFICMMAAYVFARLKLPGKKFFWGYCLTTMYIPGVTIMLTSFLVVFYLNMLDTFWVLVLPGLVSGYNIFFFRQFFLSMPTSIEEAALMDGCGRFRTFLYIFIPLSKAPMVVLGANVFIAYWNSYLWPSMTITQPEYMQIMQIIRSYSTMFTTDYGPMMAATLIAIIPPIALFFVFQKQIVKGIVLTGLK